MCHRRGHKSEDCYQRKSNGKKRSVNSEVDINDLVQKVERHMASTQQQKKQRLEIEKRARNALRDLEDEDA